jgi:hypothetical protein
MDTTLMRHLPVATCIGCGARSHSADCADGCSDQALVVVDVSDLAAVASPAEDLEMRVAKLRGVARTLASDTPADWPTVQESARAALQLPVPAEPDVQIIQAWGCPECGRIEAPQPCLGICIRRPGLVADASELQEFAERSEELAVADRALGDLARTVASVTPRPGREELTAVALRSQARQLLGRHPG